MTWCFTFRVQPPTHVISARNGADVFFAAFSPALQQWYMVYPGGEEKIDEPQMVFLEEEYASAHPSSKFNQNYSRIIPERRRKGKQVQFELAL